MGGIRIGIGIGVPAYYPYPYPYAYPYAYPYYRPYPYYYGYPYRTYVVPAPVYVQPAPVYAQPPVYWRSLVRPTLSQPRHTANSRAGRRSSSENVCTAGHRQDSAASAPADAPTVVVGRPAFVVAAVSQFAGTDSLAHSSASTS